MKIKSIIVSGLIMFTVNNNVLAANITVDGNLGDWGISQTGQASDWTPNSDILFTEEDQNSWKLEEGYGGQGYDAEALYTYQDENKLYIALATGHNPETAENGSSSFGAGDFAIDFGLDGIYEVGINIKPSWDTFGEVAGVYNNIDWAYGLWADNPETAYLNSDHPTSILAGEQLGVAELAISSAQTGYGQWGNDNHYFYEMSLDLSLLVNAGWQGEEFNIHWTQNCGNDSILLKSPANVPEPGSLVLLMAGLMGVRFVKTK